MERQIDMFFKSDNIQSEEWHWLLLILNKHLIPLGNYTTTFPRQCEVRPVSTPAFSNTSCYPW